MNKYLAIATLFVGCAQGEPYTNPEASCFSELERLSDELIACQEAPPPPPVCPEVTACGECQICQEDPTILTQCFTNQYCTGGQYCFYLGNLWPYGVCVE